MNTKVPNIDYNEAIKSSGLFKKLGFILFALVVYRLGTYIPIPGINSAVLEQIFSQHKDGILGIFDMFSGGALMRMSIFTLGVMPYISASIIMQLMQSSFDGLKALKEQGTIGRKKIQQYTRYLTIVLALFQSYGISNGMLNISDTVDPTLGSVLFFQISSVICMTAGTVFLMWLGEQITENGFGSGISIIIFAGIVANLPFAIFNTFELGRTGALSAIAILMIIALMFILIVVICFVERAQRRLLVQYPKRQVGNKVFGGQSSYLPLKVNVAGVIPAIFASSLLLFPNTISNFSSSSEGILASISFYLGHGKPLYMLAFFSLIVFFAFFYTGVVFNPKEQAENLRNYGGFVLGYRPGEQTAAYLEHVIYRLTFVGAIYLGLIALIPEMLISRLSVPFYLGGTSLLIVVVVAMDFFSQIQTQLYSSQYEKALSKNKVYKSKWL
ncbi:MAG: preprotein translocase subunit SecY [Alphaproteobacteria bacterium]|jgi:preprotein translocase subunit SecY|nr:preprotein translocase subunit SecY [Alphaproteobacteria bacterium]